MSPRKVSFALVFIAVVGTFHLALTIVPKDARASILYVGGTGPGNFTTIQSAIDNAIDGDTIYVFNGTYYENVNVYKPLSLMGEDRNVTIVDGGNGHAIYITADWVNVTGFTVTNSSLLDYSGIRLFLAQNCTIATNTVSDNHKGISLWGSVNNTITGNNLSNNEYGISAASASIHNTLTDNIIFSNSDSGIAISRSDKNSIRRNTISNSWLGVALLSSTENTMENNTMIENGIFIEGDKLEHWNTHMIDKSNTVNGKPVLYWKNVTGGIVPSDVGQIILANCTNVIVGNRNVSGGSAGITLGFSSFNIITDNNASQNGYGIYLVESYDNDVTDNNASYDTYGIYISSSWDNIITNNTLSRNQMGGVYLESSNNNIIASNTLVWNFYWGIHLSASSNNTVAVNDLPVNSYGISLSMSDGNTVLDNTATDNGVGIDSTWSMNNTILNNTVIKSSFGIRLESSDGNSIENNTASDNQVGVSLSSSNENIIANSTILSNGMRGMGLELSYNNWVYHNNFADNTLQAVDNINTNHWDNDYPSGGNYWNDYTGIDNKSGPNQDQPGSDGIGDTPYNITGDSNRDRYPLVSPIGITDPRAPRILQADLSGKNLENVTLNWFLSPDDGTGFKFVTGYRVYRNSTYDSDGLGYALVASLPNGTSEFIDNLVGEGDPDDYFYRVCASGSNNNTTCAANQAAKFTRPLSKGLNLASIPLVQSNESVEKVLQTVEFDKVWVYDSPSGKWKWFMTFKPYKGPLQSINESQGFWVNVTNDCNFTVVGVVPTQTVIGLSKGWNLVGYPSFRQDYAVAGLKADVLATRVEGYDNSTSPYSLRLMADGDLLGTGYAYWLNVPAGTNWMVRDK